MTKVIFKLQSRAVPLRCDVLWCRGCGLRLCCSGSKELLLVPRAGEWHCLGRVELQWPPRARAGQEGASWKGVGTTWWSWPTFWSERSRQCAGNNVQVLLEAAFSPLHYGGKQQRNDGPISLRNLVNWFCLKRRKHNPKCWQGIVGWCRQGLNVF